MVRSNGQMEGVMSRGLKAFPLYKNNFTVIRKITGISMTGAGNVFIFWKKKKNNNNHRNLCVRVLAMVASSYRMHMYLHTRAHVLVISSVYFW